MSQPFMIHERPPMNKHPSLESNSSLNEFSLHSSEMCHLSGICLLCRSKKSDVLIQPFPSFCRKPGRRWQCCHLLVQSCKLSWKNDPPGLSLFLIMVHDLPGSKRYTIHRGRADFKKTSMDWWCFCNKQQQEPSCTLTCVWWYQADKSILQMSQQSRRTMPWSLYSCVSSCIGLFQLEAKNLEPGLVSLIKERTWEERRVCISF